MLNDKMTGVPLCLMSANLLSAYRTGAVPGVGAKNILHPRPRILSQYADQGNGAYGSCGNALCEAFKCKHVKVKGRGTEVPHEFHKGYKGEITHSFLFS